MSEPCRANRLETTSASPEEPEGIEDSARCEIEAALSAFRQWLLETEAWRRLDHGAVEHAPEATAEPVSLHTLAREWIALRQEVHLESRTQRSSREDLQQAADRFESGLATFRESAAQLVDPVLRERDRLRDDMNQRLQAERAVWLDLMLDLREAFDRCLDESREAIGRLGWRRRLLPAGLLPALTEAYELGLRRIDAALESRDVLPMNCQGQPVDPLRMKVVDTTSDSELPEGTVATVRRPGYTCGDRVIRYAEVSAVKH